MYLMIRRSLLTAALIVAGGVAIAPKANAQSINVPFSGSIGSVCTVNSVSPGSLTPNSETSPTYMYTSSYGQFSVNCNQQAYVTTSIPSITSSPLTNPSYSYSYVSSNYGGSYADQSGYSYGHYIGSGSSNFYVEMSVGSNSALPPGNYSYVTTVSITPY
jgi:hypothetical protein